MRTLFLIFLLTTGVTSQAQIVWSEWHSPRMKHESRVIEGQDYIVNVQRLVGGIESYLLYQRDTQTNEMILLDSIKFSNYFYSDIFISQVQNGVFAIVLAVYRCDLIYPKGLFLVSQHGVFSSKDQIDSYPISPELDLIVEKNTSDGVLALLGDGSEWRKLTGNFKSGEFVIEETHKYDLWYDLNPTYIRQNNDDLFFLIDGRPHRSKLSSPEQFVDIGNQRVDNWSMDQTGQNRNLVGFKDKEIFFFSDSLTKTRQLTSSHEISSLSAINDRVLWQGNEAKNKIEWSLYTDTIKYQELPIDHHIQDPHIHLTHEDILVSGNQYIGQDINNWTCGSNQFYLPIEQVLSGFENDVELVSFRYEKSIKYLCDPGHPVFQKTGYRLINSTLVYRNRGTQTLNQFYIGYEFYAGFHFCPYTANPWILIQTDLEPGEADTMNWAELIIPCTGNSLKQGCLYAHMPNHSLDNDFSNNFVCSDFILSSATTGEDCDINIFPNPASNQFTILGCKELTQIDLYNSNGTHCKSLDPTNKEISISEFANGIYYLTVIHSSGLQTVKKLVIDHSRR